MIWDRTNRPVWLRLTVGVLVAIIAAAIRLQFLEILEFRVLFLTFFPAVAVAALYGGFAAGLPATVVSTALAKYFWVEPVGHFTITNFADLISMAVFLASGTLISCLAEAAYRAQARAHKAEEESRLAAEREKAAVELQQSESKYRELVQNANSAIIRWKRDGTIAFFNEYAQEFFGYSAEEIIGKNVNILVPEQGPTGGDPTGLVEDIVNHPERYANTINENVLRDGSLIWMAWTNRPIFDEDGQVLEILAIGSDITERKRAEDALRESEERFRVTLSSIGDAVIATDASGRINFLNPVAAQLTGWESGAASHQPIQDVLRIINEQTRQPARNVVERVLREGKTVNLANHTALISRDGRETPIEDSAAPIRDSGGNLTGVVLVFHDVTEKRRAQEDLKQSEEHYRSLFDNMLNGYAYCRMLFENDEPEDFVYLNVNSAFEALTGLENVIGKKASEVIPGIRESDSRLFEIYGRVAKTGVPERFETYVEALGMWFSASVYSPQKEHFVAVFDVITERKQAERALKESEERLQALMKALPVGVSFSDDANCRRITGNPAVLAQFEVGPQDNLSASAPDANAPGRQVRFYAEGREIGDAELPLQRAVAENREIAPMELEVLLPSGRRWFSETSGAPIRNTEGKVIGGVAVTVDITERKRIEEELRENRSRLDLALRSAHMGVWHLDLIVNKRHFDDQTCRLLGIDPAKFTGAAEEFYRAVHPGDREMLKAVWARTLEQGVHYETGYRVVWPDGGVHYISARGKLVHDDKGRPLRINGLVWDVTEHRRAEETLRTTVQRFHKILSNIFVGILVLTDDDRIEFVNQDLCDQFDIAEAPSDLIGLTAEEMLQKVLPAYADPEANLARIQRIVAKRRRIEDEEVLMRNGRVLLRDHIPILVDGKPRGRMWQHRDITGRKLAEEELRKSHDELELRVQERTAELNTTISRLELINQELQEFAHVASHDLQEPLRKIQTFCDLARKRCAPVLDGTSLEYLDRVLNSAGRMRQLLRDLLEFSRVATRPEPFKKIDLVKIVREAADVFEASVKETGCKIGIEHMPTIEADESQMLRLFQNLIGNALKFRGGEPPDVKVYGKLDRRGICELSVKDNGIGFDPKFAELIFKPFQRLHGRSEYDGTGMGLAICRKIVERHGGSIRAESEPGKGSTFIIRLPAKRSRLETIIARQQL